MNGQIQAHTLAEVASLPADVPNATLEALLHSFLGDHSAVITASICTPLEHLGTNDSSTLFRVELHWSSRFSLSQPNSATWIIKHWRAGGSRDHSLHIHQPREALAWERGWLRPPALPDDLVVPIVAAHRLPDDSEAWLAMTDVSPELSRYVRMQLSGQEAVSYSRTILARLARLHARWEAAERQAELHACSWLRRPETYLWDMALTYARALGRPPSAQIPLHVNEVPVWPGLSDDLEAFLEARPPAERRLWEDLMINRGPLVEGLAEYPQTLLHGDLDDRNIGLRWSGNTIQPGPGSYDQTRIVLIDWEWLASGPAALDVANIIQRLPILIQPGAQIPESLWRDELAYEYFKQYRAAGGRCSDAAQWQQSFALATVAQGLAQMPFIHGSLRRAICGDAPLPQIVGVPEEVIRQRLRESLSMMEKMEERVLRAAYEIVS